MLPNTPTQFESQRLILRCYQPGDGPMYYTVGQANLAHLQRYESGNIILTAKNEVEAELLVQELAADWAARKSFFLGAFDKASLTFVAQIYVGVVSWETPEFEIGFFVDQRHEGQGFVTEAVKATLAFIFEHLQARRVSLRCDETNTRSWRVAERCGFTREAHWREDKRNPDGTFSSTFCYGLLRGEYFDHPA